jgi:hypothetical protein
MRVTSSAVSASSILSGAIVFVSRWIASNFSTASAYALADVDDEEGGVEAAFDHLGQVDLRVEPLGVVLLGGEVGGRDVVVRIERDHPIVNGARLFHQRLVGGRRGRFGGLGTTSGGGRRSDENCRQHKGDRQGCGHTGWELAPVHSVKHYHAA